MRMIEQDITALDDARQQLLLLAWFSPAFPIGSFAFSHGLEWAQECGAVAGRAGLEAWLTDLLEHGSGRNDAILLAEAWRLARAGDGPALADLTDLAAALQPGRERFLEASVQGQAFLQVVQAAYGPLSPPPCGEGSGVGVVQPAQNHGTTPIPNPSPQGGREHERLTLPVAVGICGAAHGIALNPLLTAFLGGFVANLSSAAVRLGIVGQTDGQRVIAALHPAVADLARTAAGLTLDDLGSAALRSDLFSLQHEIQYSRLFRS